MFLPADLHLNQSQVLKLRRGLNVKKIKRQDNLNHLILSITDKKAR